MKLKPTLKPLLAISLAVGLTGCATILLKVAKGVGGLTTEKLSTLDDVVATVGMGTNLHPVELGTVSQSLFSGWKTGGDVFSVMFTRKSAFGFVKLDGEVTIDGKPMEYGLAGVYGLVTDANASPRKVEVTMKSGQKASFLIEPPKERLKLLSINGKKDGEIALDLTQDVTLELEIPAGLENKLIKATIAITQIGLKEHSDVCYIRAASKVVIPAGAFRNIGLAPASTALYSFKNTFFSVAIEDTAAAKDVTGPLASIKYNTFNSDGKFVSVAKEPKINTGLVYKGEDKDLEVKYDYFKPGAFFSRPFSQVKTVALKSFSIRGTTYSQSTSTSETSTTITTTTTTLKFPEQPDAVWDALLEKLYPDFIAVIQSELDCTVLPVENVTGAEAYKSIADLAKDDVNTKVQFTRGFRNTKVVSAFMPITDGYGANGVDEKLMAQTGANSLLSMTIDLEISTDGKLVLMIPKFAIQLYGKTNGPNLPTKYFNGSIQSITGVSFNQNITQAELEKIVRKDVMVAALRKGLQDLKAKEKANGDYGPVWALQAEPLKTSMP